MKKVGDIFSGLGEETTYVGTNSVMKDEKDGLYNDNYSTTKSTDLRSNSVEKLRDVKTDKVLDGVKIMPLSGDIKNLLTKKKYKNKFDHVFLSQQTAHYLEQDGFKSVLRSGATVSVETGKFVFPLSTNCQQKEMVAKIMQMATTLEMLPNYQATDDDILCFNS